MKHKQLATDSIERIVTLLNAFDSNLSRGMTLLEAREKLEVLKERLDALQTLINSESDSWN